MKAKSLVLSLAMATLILSVGVAQPKTPSKGERLTQLKEKLELTNEQTAKIETILTSSQNETEKKSSTDRREQMEAMKRILDEEDVKIEQLLTDRQKTVFAELKKEREQRRPQQQGERQQDGQGPPRKN